MALCTCTLFIVWTQYVTVGMGKVFHPGSASGNDDQKYSWSPEGLPYYHCKHIFLQSCSIARQFCKQLHVHECITHDCSAGLHWRHSFEKCAQKHGWVAVGIINYYSARNNLGNAQHIHLGIFLSLSPMALHFKTCDGIIPLFLSQNIWWNWLWCALQLWSIARKTLENVNICYVGFGFQM